MAAGFTCWKCLSRKASQSCMVSQPNTSVLRQDSPPPVSDCLPFTILSCVVTSGRQRLDTCKSGGLRAISCSVRFRGWRPEHLQGSICSECLLFGTLGMGGHKWLARPVSTLQLHLLDITHEVMASWKMRPSILRHSPYVVLPEDPTMVTSGDKVLLPW